MLTIWETPTPMATILDRPATTQLGLTRDFLTQLRWDLLQRTGMVYTTWRGMCSNGVGIGMERLMDSQQLLIQPARHLRRPGNFVFGVAAVFSMTPRRSGAQIASITTLIYPTITLVFAV